VSQPVEWVRSRSHARLSYLVLRKAITDVAVLLGHTSQRRWWRRRGVIVAGTGTLRGTVPTIRASHLDIRRWWLWLPRAETGKRPGGVLALPRCAGFAASRLITHLKHVLELGFQKLMWVKPTRPLCLELLEQKTEMRVSMNLAPVTSLSKLTSPWIVPILTRPSLLDCHCPWTHPPCRLLPQQTLRQSWTPNCPHQKAH
jgi:hypothetical protein